MGIILRRVLKKLVLFPRNKAVFETSDSKSSKIQCFGKRNFRDLGKHLRDFEKNASFLASKLNEPVVTNYTPTTINALKKASKKQ